MPLQCDLLFFTDPNLVLELRADELGNKRRIEDIVKESRWRKRREGGKSTKDRQGNKSRYGYRL